MPYLIGTDVYGDDRSIRLDTNEEVKLFDRELIKAGILTNTYTSDTDLGIPDGLELLSQLSEPEIEVEIVEPQSVYLVSVIEYKSRVTSESPNKGLFFDEQEASDRFQEVVESLRFRLQLDFSSKLNWFESGDSIALALFKPDKNNTVSEVKLEKWLVS